MHMSIKVIYIYTKQTHIAAQDESEHKRQLNMI